MKSMFEINTICRLCLKVDVKVYKLSSPHQAFIESIFKLKQFNYIPSEDNYVCYICKALLSKTFIFIQAICNAQEIVCDLLKNTDLITKPILECIDRQKNRLNPIDLSSFAIICENELTDDSCEVKIINTDEIVDEIEVKEVDFLNISEEGQSEQEQKFKKNVPMTTNNESSDFDENSCIEVGYSDVIICDPLEVNNKKLKHKLKKNIGTNACDGPKIKAPSKSLKKSIAGKRKKKRDEDYQPDSTSHSEDSEFDSYDDEGKEVKRPYHGLKYPRKCDHCDYEVLRRNHYRHYVIAHPNIEYPYSLEKTYACSICGKLKTKLSIGNHERNHIVQKIKCKLCPKVFSYGRQRIRHMSNVHPKKTYTCDYCSKIFKTRTDITRHFRIHTGSKPFKCHICEAAFAHSGNRTLHIRSAHQNYKYVPKKHKRTAKRRKNKHDSSDTENNSDSALVTLKKKRKLKKQRSKNKKVNCSDTAMLSDEKLNKKRKKNTRNASCTDTNVNIDLQEDTINNKNAEIESDDEILADIQRNNT